MSSPPTGPIGHLNLLVDGNALRIVQADPRAWIAVTLIDGVREGRAIGCVALEGDLLSIDAVNVFVSYRITATTQHLPGGETAKIGDRVECRPKVGGDPFKLRAPFRGNPQRMADPGRLVTAGHIDAGWSCRWCARELAFNARVRAVVCVFCDYPERDSA